MFYDVFNPLVCQYPLIFQGEGLESEIGETLTERELNSLQQKKFGYNFVLKNTLFQRKIKIFS